MTDVTAQYENDAFTTITNATLNPADTTITVAAGEGALFPNVSAPQYFYATLENLTGDIEVVRVTEHLTSSDTFTVSRGQDNTGAGTFSSGTYFEMRANAAVFEELRDAITTKDDITSVDAKIAAGLGDYLPLAGGTLTGQAKGITPLADDDLTRKDYVDQLNFIDLPASYSGPVVSNQTVLRFITARAYVLPLNFTDTVAKCVSAPSSSVTFTVLKNGVSIGTIIFNGGSTTANTLTSAGSTFAVGDVLTIESPSNTFGMEDLAITLTGVFTF